MGQVTHMGRSEMHRMFEVGISEDEGSLEQKAVWRLISRWNNSIRMHLKEAVHEDVE
jgi:hypothetical protein